MSGKLNGKRIAMVVEDGFEQEELLRPKQAFEEAGAKVNVVSPRAGKVKGWKHGRWGDSVPVDVGLDDARADDYDALVLPGGVMNPDKLRRNESAWRFVQAFFAAKKPVGAICHGPWTLIDAGVIDGRRMTSYPSLQTDLRNAGAEWVDEEVVVDRMLATSRNPRDIPAFIRALIELIAGEAG